MNHKWDVSLHIYSCFVFTWYYNFYSIYLQIWIILIYIRLWSSPNLFIICFILYRLSSMVKACIIGTICHTTDILNVLLCRVHWMKPPSFLFVLWSNLIIFVESIITLHVSFVNTIFHFISFRFSFFLTFAYSLNFLSFYSDISLVKTGGNIMQEYLTMLFPVIIMNLYTI